MVRKTCLAFFFPFPAFSSGVVIQRQTAAVDADCPASTKLISTGCLPCCQSFVFFCFCFVLVCFFCNTDYLALFLDSIWLTPIHQNKTKRKNNTVLVNFTITKMVTKYSRLARNSAIQKKPFYKKVADDF